MVAATAIVITQSREGRKEGRLEDEDFKLYAKNIVIELGTAHDLSKEEIMTEFFEAKKI
nr:11821_t:CDS:2 [Entrophospora candida]